MSKIFLKSEPSQEKFFNIYQIGKSLETVAGEPKKISVNGGLSQSPLWVQIMADVFGKEIHLSDTHHNAAWGAAWRDRRDLAPCTTRRRPPAGACGRRVSRALARAPRSH